MPRSRGTDFGVPRRRDVTRSRRSARAAPRGLRVLHRLCREPAARDPRVSRLGPDDPARHPAPPRAPSDRGAAWRKASAAGQEARAGYEAHREHEGHESLDGSGRQAPTRLTTYGLRLPAASGLSPVAQNFSSARLGSASGAPGRQELVQRPQLRHGATHLEHPLLGCPSGPQLDAEVQVRAHLEILAHLRLHPDQRRSTPPAPWSCQAVACLDECATPR